MTTVSLLNIMKNRVSSYRLSNENHTQYNQFENSAAELFQSLEKEGRRWVGVCDAPYHSSLGDSKAIVFETRSDYALGWYHAPNSWLGHMKASLEADRSSQTVVSSFDDFPPDVDDNPPQEAVQPVSETQ